MFSKNAYVVLNRTEDAYEVTVLTLDEAAARSAYNKALDELKALNKAGVALMLVKLFAGQISIDDISTIDQAVGEGFTSDVLLDRTLTDILDRSGEVCDCLEYYEFEEEPAEGYRVALADFESDDFDINVEFGMQDPDECDVIDEKYLLKPDQTKGDLVVYLSETCGYTSIYVHDERPATPEEIKSLTTFPTTGRGHEYADYGEIDED